MGVIETLLGAPAAVIAWSLAAGFGLVVIAKLLGLIFLRGETVHRIGASLGDGEAVVSEWRSQSTFGRVDVGGEIWRATSTDNLKPGDRVVITGMSGLTVAVRKS
ncbi:MAG: hypothetical protein GC152_01815 [Alphaproteobacteria bacterium]|nr:hypothetical protein [Alphaproteobacteria bacterium]